MSRGWAKLFPWGVTEALSKEVAFEQKDLHDKRIHFGSILPAGGLGRAKVLRYDKA